MPGPVHAPERQGEGSSEAAVFSTQDRQSRLQGETIGGLGFVALLGGQGPFEASAVGSLKSCLRKAVIWGILFLKD